MQKVDGEITQIISPTGGFYLEDTVSPKKASESGKCFSSLRARSVKASGQDIFGGDPAQTVQMSFFMPTKKLFGVPEREDTLELKRTTGADPYELFATDHLHTPGTKGPLYGSIPYVNGISTTASTSVLWVNSAKTYLDIDDYSMAKGDGVNLDGSLATFSSEAGAMEFFVFASVAPSKVSGLNRA